MDAIIGDGWAMGRKRVTFKVSSFASKQGRIERKPAIGYPLTIKGFDSIRFIVHHPTANALKTQWRVSEMLTGDAVLLTTHGTRKQAILRCIDKLSTVTEAHLQKQIALSLFKITED